MGKTKQNTCISLFTAGQKVRVNSANRKISPELNLVGRLKNINLTLSAVKDCAIQPSILNLKRASLGPKIITWMLNCDRLEKQTTD